LPDEEVTVDIFFKDPKQLEHLFGENWNNQTIYWQGKPDGAIKIHEERPKPVRICWNKEKATLTFTMFWTVVNEEGVHQG
jgi:hypothetical protein